MDAIDVCVRCKKQLRDYDDFPPVKLSGKVEMCADCYNDLSYFEKYSDFGRF